MGYTFNPLTGQFDIVGTGGGGINVQLTDISDYEGLVWDEVLGIWVNKPVHIISTPIAYEVIDGVDNNPTCNVRKVYIGRPSGYWPDYVYVTGGLPNTVDFTFAVREGDSRTLVICKNVVGIFTYSIWDYNSSTWTPYYADTGNEENSVGSAVDMLNGFTHSNGEAKIRIESTDALQVYGIAFTTIPVDAISPAYPVLSESHTGNIATQRYAQGHSWRNITRYSAVNVVNGTSGTDGDGNFYVEPDANGINVELTLTTPTYTAYPTRKWHLRGIARNTTDVVINCDVSGDAGFDIAINNEFTAKALGLEGFDDDTTYNPDEVIIIIFSNALATTGRFTIKEVYAVPSWVRPLGRYHPHRTFVGLDSPDHVETSLRLSDNTVNDATSNRHGFLSKLSGSTSDVLRGDGTWGAGGGGTAFVYEMSVGFFTGSDYAINYVAIDASFTDNNFDVVITPDPIIDGDHEDLEDYLLEEIHMEVIKDSLYNRLIVHTYAPNAAWGEYRYKVICSSVTPLATVPIDGGASDSLYGETLDGGTA